MIMRNAAVRLGRRTLAAPISRSLLRRVSTQITTKTSTEAQPQQAGAVAWPTVQPPAAAPRIAKKAKASQDGIFSLGIDSAHEHKGAAWTTFHPTTNSATPATPAEKYAEFQRIQKATRSLGSKVEKRYVPTELVTNPPAPEDVTLELLMASQTHIGHKTSLWNPANSRYIYGVRQGVHIISLETTAAHLRRAARVVEDVTYRGGLVLFVGTREGQMEIVTKAAEMAGACHLFTKWTPGAITNRDVILSGRGVKVVDHLDQELDGFSEYPNAARPLMPDLVVCLNPLENYTILYECGLKGIPTIGVIDTNTDPSWVTYTIPANDDSHRAMAVVAGVLGRAGQSGQKRRLDDAAKGKVTWKNPEELSRYMFRQKKIALAQRKEVMGKLQANIEGFNEEEQKLLKSQFSEEDLNVSETEMLNILGEAAAGDKEVQSPLLDTLGGIEKQMTDLKKKAVAIEEEIKGNKKQ